MTEQPKATTGRPRQADTMRLVGLALGAVAGLVILLVCDLKPGHPAVTATAAVAVLMAVWWITEALPLAITSLVPVVLLPLLGVMNGKAVSSQYFNHIKKKERVINFARREIKNKRNSTKKKAEEFLRTRRK